VRGDVKHSRTGIWVLVGGGAFVLFVVVVFVLVYFALRSGNGDEASAFGGFGDKIGVVDLEGVILDSDTVVHELKKFGDDDSIKAIIIHVNSPGGGVAASEEIYREVKRLRDEKHKHIVASISTVGASGAYYVSSATNKIYADNGSVVGSIGVIAEWVNYGDLMRWAKLKPEVLKVGALKDTGDPTRDMTPEERAFMQSLINNMYGQFVNAVAEGRHEKPDDIKAIADGRVWTGQEALSMKLIDQIGDFQTAVDDTAKAVNIKGEPTLVYPQKERKTLLDLLVGDTSKWIPNREKLMEQQVGFYYLWR
ncbi:MAG: signal peptide peptidase SppA, partial [Candidatus Angelobacter sp.]